MSVMRRWAITTIENLILSDKETDNDNRKRIAYHVFLSRYCIKFQRLDPVQQQNIIDIDNNSNKEEGDDDSTIPPI